MGWSEKAPKKGKQREQLAKSCGGKCFLMPEKRKFPVCARCNGSVCTCKPSCEGLKAARIRAAQYHYTQVKERADKLLAEHGCSQAKKKKKRLVKKKTTRSSNLHEKTKGRTTSSAC